MGSVDHGRAPFLILYAHKNCGVGDYHVDLHHERSGVRIQRHFCYCTSLCRRKNDDDVKSQFTTVFAPNASRVGVRASPRYWMPPRALGTEPKCTLRVR